MEASTTRIFNRHLTRHPFLTFKFPPTTTTRRNPNHNKILFPMCPRPRPRCLSLSSSSSVPPPFSNPLSQFLLSLSATQSVTSPPDRPHFDSKDKSRFSWNRGPPAGSKEEGDVGFMPNKGPVMAVALLGWLGAEEKHLKRYVELYTSKGVHALSFVIPVREVVRFDSVRRVEERVLALAEELISWLSQSEEDGRERALLFHTFSNTGWFAYGAILNHLQARGEFMDKIRGCVVDSGADPELDPQNMLMNYEIQHLQSQFLFPLIRFGRVFRLGVVALLLLKLRYFSCSHFSWPLPVPRYDCFFMRVHM